MVTSTMGYVVRRGDTLEKIAQDHGTNVEVLVRYNHIKDPSRITIGQIVQFEPSISVQVLDRLHQPIAGLKLALNVSGQCLDDAITCADGWVRDIVLPSFSDVLRVFVYKPSGDRKQVAQIKPSGIPKVVRLVSPKIRVSAVSAKALGGIPQPGETSAAVTLTTSRTTRGTPVVLVATREEPSKEKSGLMWAKRFPTSTNLDDLKEPFRTSAKEFVQALEAAKVDVKVSATFRPTERSYLMYYSAKIARGEIDVTKVPKWRDVDIDWAHLDADGVPDVRAAKAAAQRMVSAFEIGHRPVGAPGSSNHNKKLAMDLTIRGYANKSVVNPDGKAIKLEDWDDLVELGEEFGVRWFGQTDKPHWSINGK